MSQLAIVLKRLMLISKLTESELARRTGIAQPVIHRLSSGETDNPKIDTLIPIANYFKLDLSELIGEHPLPPQYAEKQVITPASVIQYWQKVPLLEWEQVRHWLDTRHAIQPIRDIGTPLELSEIAFAVECQDHSLHPTIPMGSALIFEPERNPKHGDLCCIQEGNRKPVVVQYQELENDDEENANKISVEYVPVNPEFRHITINFDGFQQLGVCVQAIFE